MTLIGLTLMLIHHKWKDDQYLVMLLIMFSIYHRDYYKLVVKALEPKTIGKYMTGKMKIGHRAIFWQNSI